MPGQTEYDLRARVSVEGTPEIAKAGTAATNMGKALDSAGGAARGFGGHMGRAGTHVRDFDDQVGRAVGGLSRMIATVVSVGAAIQGLRRSRDIFGEIETGMVAVEKTTNLSREALEGMNRRLSQLSVGELPILKTEMLAIGAAAGQLGVQGVENIESYIKTLGQLQVATDLAGEEGAKSLTRILNVQGEGPENIGRLGSALVALGNDAAASESEIVQVATSVAASTAQFKIGSGPVLAWATALKESGVQAQLGGSAIGRTMREIQSAVAEGGDTLQEFARIAGVTAGELSAAFRSDASAGTLLFLQGLSRFGADASIAMERVGLSGDELNKVLPNLAGNVDRLALRLEQSATNWEQNTALTEEATKAFNTQSSDLQRLQNAFLLVGEQIGRGMSPAVRSNAQEIREWLVTNEDAARSLGESLGTALSAAVDLLKFAAENTDLLKSALVLLVAVKAGAWVSSLTSALVAYAGAAGTATAASRTFLATGITPLGAGLGILLAVIFKVNSAITDFARRQERAIADMTSDVERFRTAVNDLKSDAQLVLESGNLQDMEGQLSGAISALEAATSHQTDLRNQILSLQAEEAEAIANAAAAQERYGGSIEGVAIIQSQLSETLRVNREQQQELTIEMNRANEVAGVQEGIIRATTDAMRNWKPAVAEAGETLDLLGESASQTRNEMDELLSSLEAERSSLENLTKAALGGGRAFAAAERQAKVEQQFRAESARLAGEHADRLGELRTALEGVAAAEQRLSGAQTIGALREQAQALRSVVTAYQEGTEAGAAQLAVLEVEKELRAQVAGAADEQRAEIEKLVQEVAALEAAASGQEALAALDQQLQTLELVAAAYRKSTVAGQAMERQLNEQAEAARRAAPQIAQVAIVSQQLAAARSVLALSQTGVLALSEQNTQAIETEIDRLQDQLNINEELIASIRERVQLAGQGQQQVAAEGDLARQRERVEILRKTQEALEGLTLGEKLFGDAAKVANLELEIQRRIMAAGVDATSEMAAEIRRLATEELALSESISATANLSDQWVQLGNTIGSILQGVDSELSGIVNNAVNAFQSFRALQQTSGGIEGAAAGAQFGNDIGQLAIGFGIGTGDRGTGRFGGQLSGDYTDTGAEIGGFIGGFWGPVGGAIGAAAGAIIGSFVNRGADEATAIFEQRGQELFGAVREYNSALEDALNVLVDGVLGSVQEIEILTGVSIIPEDFSIKIRDDIITVMINGFVGAFEGDDAIRLALNHVISEIIRHSSEIIGEVGPNVQHVFENAGFEVEGDEFKAVLELANALDAGTIAISPFVEAMRNEIRVRLQMVDLARKYELNEGEVLKLVNERVGLLKQEAEALLDQQLGVKNYLQGAQEIAAAIEAVNTGLARERREREDLIRLTEERLLQNNAEFQSIDQLIQSLGGLEAATEEVARLQDLIGDGVTSDRAEQLEEQILLWHNLQNTIPETDEGLVAMRESLESLPVAIDVQQIADAFSLAGSNAALDLISLLQQVQGEQFLAAEMQQAQAVIYRLQLAAQIASVANLLVATDMLDVATRRLLETILSAASATLAAIERGDLQVNLGRGGRSPSIPSGGGNAGRDTARELEEALQKVQELRLLASGVSEASIALLNGFRDFASFIDDARELGIAEAELAQARADNLQLVTQELLAPFEEAIRQASETEVGTSIRERAEEIETALDQAMTLALERAAAFGTSLAEEFEPLRDVILQAFGADLGQDIRDSVAELARGGDLLGIRSLIEDLQAVDLSGVSPRLARAYEEILDQLVDQAEAVAAAIAAVGPVSPGFQADVDASGVRPFLDILAGASEVELQLQAIQGAFAALAVELRLQEALESDLTIAREAHAAAIGQVRDAIMDSVQQYTDAVLGISDVERNLIDLQQTFEDARAGLAAVEAAGATAGELFADQTLVRRFDQLEFAATGAADGAADLVSDLELLDRAQRQATQALGVDFIQSLDSLGVSLPIPIVLELADAQFRLAQAQAIATATALAAAGAFDGMSFTLEELLELIAGADIERSQFAPRLPPPPAPPRGPTIDRDAIADRLKEQIEAWNRLALGDVTRRVLDLKDTFNDLKEEARKARLPIEGLQKAFKVALAALADEVLAPFEDLALSPLERELRDINVQFQDIRRAFTEMGATAAQWERLEAAQAAALENFWKQALAPVQSLIEELEREDPRRTPQQAFTSALTDFRSLAARAKAGDLEAISELEAQARRLLDENAEFLGGSGAGIAIRDEILAALREVTGAAGLEDPVVTEQKKTNEILKSILQSVGGALPRPITAPSSLASALSQPANVAGARPQVTERLKDQGTVLMVGESSHDPEVRSLLEKLVAQNRDLALEAEKRERARRNAVAADIEQRQSLIGHAELSSTELTAIRREMRLSSQPAGARR